MQSGTRLGPYEIAAPLGAGGMGQVYRAVDTRLGRGVAIKVLPTAVAEQPNVRERFVREARAVSSLSHPHICALFDVGQHGTTDFLVMELVDGESLADRIVRGKLSCNDVLTLGAQIADALDHAHRRGIVHRDLKPGNIMLSRSGAKVLDFGLAKLHAAEQPQVEAINDSPLPTRTHPITAEGAILGTLHYMAPEQVEGKEADARSDIFALGAVLYEMATGKRAFDGESKASVIAAVLERQPPPMAKLAPMTPPVLERIVHRSLAKDPEDRWQSARDVALELRAIAEGDTGEGLPSAVKDRQRFREIFAWTVAGISLTSMLIIGLWSLRGRPMTNRAVQPIRFAVNAPPGALFEPSVLDRPFSISPDGTQLVFTATTPAGQSGLWIRRFDDAEARLVPDTQGAASPFWSPDSRFVGFFAGGLLKKMAADGGPPEVICRVPAATAAGDWGNRDVILFSTFPASPSIYRVDARGGVPDLVVNRDVSSGRLIDAWPSFLPDGDHFLWVSYEPSDARFYARVGSLESGEKVTLFPVDSRVTYARPGYLLYVREGTLMAQAFDPESLAVIGERTPIATDVMQSTSTGGSSFAVSETGVLAYQGNRLPTQLKWLDRDGREMAKVGEPQRYLNLRLSPGADRAATSIVDPRQGTTDIWILDLERGVPNRLTTNPDNEFAPVWSPAGDELVFTATWNAPPHLYRQALSGQHKAEMIVPPGEIQIPSDWFPNAPYVVYFTSDPQMQRDLWLVPLAGDRAPIPLLRTPFNDAEACFSPDGRAVAYVSDVSGRPEVYLHAIDWSAEEPNAAPSLSQTSDRLLASTAGGTQPRWSAENELFFIAADNHVISVPVTFEPSMKLGKAKVLFHVQPATRWREETYDVSSDGQRFLVRISQDGANYPPITVLTNWTALLEQIAAHAQTRP